MHRSTRSSGTCPPERRPHRSRTDGDVGLPSRRGGHRWLCGWSVRYRSRGWRTSRAPARCWWSPTTARTWTPRRRLGRWSPQRTRHPLHGQGRDARWPVAGWLARNAGVFFVRRGSGDRSAQRMALAILEGGGALGLFPEGTRGRNGRLAEGRAGAALLAMRTGVPIVPVGVAGTQHIFRGRRLIPRRSRVTIGSVRRFSCRRRPTVWIAPPCAPGPRRSCGRLPRAAGGAARSLMTPARSRRTQASRTRWRRLVTRSGPARARSTARWSPAPPGRPDR